MKQRIVSLLAALTVAAVAPAALAQAYPSKPIRVVVPFRRFARKPHRPDTGLLQLLERTRDVDDGRNPRVRQRSSRSLADDAVE